MVSRFGKFITLCSAVLLSFLLCFSAVPAAVAAGSGDDVTASGCNYPTAIEEGKSFALKGTVSSESSKIVRLEAGVYNSQGHMLTGRSWNPKAKSIDLRWYVNPYVEFGKLAAGTYTYKIAATNGSVKKTLLSQSFEVTPGAKAADGLSAQGCNSPTSLTKGKGYALRGKVVSQSSKITNITAGVYDRNLNLVTGRSFNPKAKSVDIRWKVNPYVKFGTLDVGTYSYKIIATNGEGQKTLLSQDFEVKAADPVSDKLSASGMSAPSLLIKGRGFYLRGIVSSQTSKISQLTAGVFDANGTMLTGRSWNPKAKSVDFRWLVNEHVKFGSLELGTYTYKVIATNDGGSSVLLEASFQVVE
jgi:hypothetical protein